MDQARKDALQHNDGDAAKNSAREGGLDGVDGAAGWGRHHRLVSLQREPGRGRSAGKIGEAVAQARKEKEALLQTTTTARQKINNEGLVLVQ